MKKRIIGKERAALYARLKRGVVYTTYEGRAVRRLTYTTPDEETTTIVQDVCTATTERKFINLAIFDFEWVLNHCDGGDIAQDN